MSSFGRRPFLTFHQALKADPGHFHYAFYELIAWHILVILPKVTLRNIPKDKELADFSIRLFGKRTRMVRTFKKCIRHRNLAFKVDVDGASGDRREATYKQQVKCLRKKVSKKSVSKSQKSKSS